MARSDVNWHGIGKNATGGGGFFSGRGLSRVKTAGGGGTKKNRRKQWYEGAAILKDGKYFSQKYSAKRNFPDYKTPVNSAA
jgi:hypothetical protein